MTYHDDSDCEHLVKDLDFDFDLPAECHHIPPSILDSKRLARSTPRSTDSALAVQESSGDSAQNDAQQNENRARHAMLASVAGNCLEWFDFGVFAFLSPQIGKLFFPPSDRFVSTLNAYVVFGGAFIFRPLGRDSCYNACKETY
jgi:hypothetical protein